MSTISNATGIDFRQQLWNRMMLEGCKIFMAQQGLLDMFIQERIDMLLTKFNKTRSTKSEKEHQRILQAEHFIDALPDKERELVQEYIERFSDCLASEEPHLYQQVFIDGISVLNLLGKP